MDFVNRILFKVTGRKVVVFVVASAFLAAGIIEQEQWMWVAVATGGFVSVEKFAGLLGGKAKSDA